jgi:hypothetical protein
MRPADERLAELRRRDPEAVLLWPQDDRWHGRHPDGRETVYVGSDLESILAAIVANGGRAVVLEPVRDARGKPVERIVTKG